MNLLGAVLYDPTTAASKSTASLLAMTAFDTANLRLAITVPAHGMVFFRMFGGAVTGATTVPTLLIGALNGATVIGRVNPQDFPGTMNATTQSCPLYAEWVATGLTPGAMNVDLAYAVQVVVASTNIKYGGPNTNAGANAWGAISFQAWDPQPLKLALGGGVNVTQWNGTAVATPATAGVPDVNVKNINNVATSSVTTINANVGQTQPVNFTGTGASALVKSDMVDIAGAAVATGTAQIGVNVVNAAGTAWGSGAITAASIAATALNGKGDWNVGKTGYSLTQTFPTNFSALAITAGGAVTAGTVSDKSGYSLTTAPLDAAGTRAAVGLASANLDTQLGTLLTSAAYTAPDNTSITAIKAKTDSLTFTVAGKLDVNVLVVNGIAVTGLGTVAVPWGP